MLKTIVVLFISVILFSCSGEEKRTDLDVFGMTGNVQSVTTVSYDAFDKFGEGNIEKANPEFSVIRICDFDESGNILVDKCGFIKKSEHSSTNFYNDSKQCIKTVYYLNVYGKEKQYGSFYYYDDKGMVIKAVDINNPKDVTYYTYKFDKEGRMLSKSKGQYWKETWEYENGELVKYTDSDMDGKIEEYYKDGLMYKRVLNKNLYRLMFYDEYKRLTEIDEYKNNVLNGKTQYFYSSPDSKQWFRAVTYDANGKNIKEKAYESPFTYFVMGKDTLSVFFKYDEKNIYISFNNKNGNDSITEKYKCELSDFVGYQFIYENGELISLKDLESSNITRYVDGIATVIESNEGKVTETKYCRNNQISQTIKDGSGKITYMYIKEGGNDKKSITITENGVTKKGEEVYENGKLVKSINAKTGVTSTYSYNEKGFVSKEKRSDGKTWTYQYDYDIYGNWIRKIKFENNIPKTILERSIKYYEPKQQKK